MPPIGQADQGGTVERILFAPDAGRGRFFIPSGAGGLRRCDTRQVHRDFIETDGGIQS